MLIDLRPRIRLTQIAEPDAPENLRSLVYLLRLNVKTFFTLLQILLPELEQFAPDEPLPENSKRRGNSADRITAIARRILPTLRHYSSWLQSNAHVLVAQESDAFIGVQIKEFWKIYANALTLLAATFTVGEFPNVDYLLEEDTDTLGFKPFMNHYTTRRYNDSQSGSNGFKPRCDGGVEQHHPNIEMLFRIREILTDGLYLVVSNSNVSKSDLHYTVPYDLSRARQPVFQSRSFLSLEADSNTRKKASRHNSPIAPPTYCVNILIATPTLRQALDETTSSRPERPAPELLAKLVMTMRLLSPLQCLSLPILL